MRRIGVLGGSFNPPTIGHQNVIEQAFPHFDEILLVPSLAHAFHKKFIAIEHRLAMLQLLIKHWENQSGLNKVKILNIEQQLLEAQNEYAPIYTYDVLNAVEALYLGSYEQYKIQFIVGPDLAVKEVWEKFYRYQDIETKWPLFLVKELFPIHSTQIKEIITQKKNSPDALKMAISPYLDPDICEYILENHLYE